MLDIENSEGCGCCNKPTHNEPTSEDLECCKQIHNINFSNYKNFKSFDFSY